MQANVDGKINTLPVTALFFKVSKRVLPDAVPAIQATWASASAEMTASASQFGWMSGACPAPNKGDHYVVEFTGKRDYRILAYIDRFGRVFSADAASVVPPARKPDLNFARFPEQQVAGKEYGCVEICDAGGASREVAQYECVQGRYTFFDSWFDFGPHGSNLSYNDALARAYLAFVYRPAQGGAEVPERGLGFVRECLDNGELLAGMHAITDKVKSAEADPVVQPPALIKCLARWLTEAGLADLKVPDDALRLIRTARYANTYYLLQENEESAVPRSVVWALEGALNRFLLTEQAFGEKAARASEVDCCRWDAYHLETAGIQEPHFERSAGMPQGVSGGEWDVRCDVGVALERLRLPLRIEVRQRMDVNEGVAAFELTTPSGALMPPRRWSDVAGAAGWHEVTSIEQEAQAARYAMHVALVLSVALFTASPLMQKIKIVARPLHDKKSKASKEEADTEALEGEFPLEVPAYFYVTLTRKDFEDTSQFYEARRSDPLPFFESAGALFTVLGVDVFAAMYEATEPVARKELPELSNSVLPDAAQLALGVREACDLRVVADAQRRAIGEGLADRIAQTQSAIESVRAVREEQEAAEKRGDMLTVSACTRLMTALAHGSLDTGEQNEVVSCFLGEDQCLAALKKASALTDGNLDKAVKTITDTLAEVSLLDGLADGPTVVYRSFDSYAARVLYERARRQFAEEQEREHPVSLASVPTLAARAKADAGKRVQLVSDSFYLCHLEVVNLRERSFEHVDEALRFGHRAIEVAPATAGGYRMLGRAYMLVGDTDSAIAALDSCLRIAIQPADIAIAYYQLAYVLWKAGRPREGAACYLKSIMTSPSMALQSVTELKELIADQGIDPIERDEVDEILVAAHIVVAPTSAVLDALDAGAAAAVDADLFAVAHNLLSLRLRYRPDDALVNVLRSLDGSSA